MKNIMLKKTMPLVAATWTDALRRVRNRIALVAAAICAAAAPLSSFAEAKSATLKATGYSGSTLTGFQALVKLSDNDAYGFSYTEAGGASHNIWFTSVDGATVYPHEIDKWDTSGDSFVWVRLPELMKGTTFKMHWSDSSGDVQQPASGNVWDGYVGVWHMNETGTTTAPDSTANGIGAAPVNNSGTLTSIATATGKVGAGRSVTQGTMLKVEGHKGHISDAKVFTIGGWVNRTATGSYPRIFCGNVDSGRTQWELFATADNDISVRGGSKEFSGCAVNNGTSSGWHYLTVVYNGTTATLYDNGTSYVKSGTINNAAQGNFFTIGGWTGRNDRSFVGTFDEVRMYNGALSADRVAADYATMNNPTEFLKLVVADAKTAMWTGGGNDGSPANAANWQVTQGETVLDNTLPDGDTIVIMQGQNIDMQLPTGSTLACKEFEIGNCTFTANCDWRGLSQTPTIDGTANLNGHVLKLNDLSAETGSAFSGGDGSFVEFVVDESVTIANLYEYTYIENIDNLTFSGSAKIRLLKKDGNGTLTVTRLELGNKRNGEMVQANGTVNLGNAVNAIGENSGKTAKYTMSGGTLTTGTGSEFQVGSNGTGEFIQTGGDVTIRNWGSIGRIAGTGTYTISGGTLTTTQTGRPIWIGGDNSSGRGTLNISGTAVVTLAGGIDAGRGSTSSHGSHGYINQNGGTLNIGDANEGFNIGRDAIAEYVQNAGDLVVNPVFRLAWGTYNNVSGTYTLNGGTATLKNTFYVGVGKNGVFTQNGGKMSALAGIKIAEGSSGIGTFTLSGGVLETTFLRKGAGTLNGITFDGGTIVATNVTDGANFITGLNNVTYGPGGLTLDTAGNDVTMATASGAKVAATAGSTFTKTGSGTLTVAAVPPVGNMVVSSGTLALSATCDNASMLAHRWSFTSDYTDSIGSSDGTAIGSNLVIENGEVVMSGNGNSTGSLNLGKGVVPSGDATIEIWATRTGVKKWARVFDYGTGTTDYFIMTWVNDTNGSGEKVILKKNNVDNASDNTMTYEDNVKYHISVTFKVNDGGSTTVSWARRNVETGAVEKSGLKTYSDWTLANLSAGNFYLGHSQWSSDFDANAKYDEVRIWNGALSADALALSVQKGPDATAADIAEIVAASPAARTLTLESGTTLDIGAGNTLTQPVVSGSGTVQNGTLNVTEKLSPGGDGVVGTIAINSTAVVTGTIRLDYGDAITTTGSVDLSNATIDLAFTPTEGSTVAMASGSGTFTGVPAVTVNGKTSGWQFVLSDDGKTLSIARRNAPDTYLEYVESNGKQWVNLSNLTQTRDIIFDADIDWISGGTFIGQGYYDQNPFTTINGEICCKWYMSDGDNGAHTGVTLPSGRHRFVVTGRNNAKLTVSVDGGASIESTATSSRRDMGEILGHSLYLFAQHSGGGSNVGNYSSVKLYGLKVYGADGGLVLDLVPGMKGREVGLYDRLNDIWYTSESGTSLLRGPITSRNNASLSNAPDAYLEYVESDGRQRINTGVTPGPNTAGVTSMIVDADVDWISGDYMLSSNWNDFHPLRNVNGKIGAAFKNTGGSVMSLGSDKDMNSGRRRVITTAVYNKPLTVNVDGDTAASSGNVGSLGSGRTLYAFASNDGSAAGSGHSTAKLYGMKIYIGNELVCDYVPGIKNGVAGLYDMQNDEWHYVNSGIELIPGPVVNPQNLPDAYLDYVKSTGAQWVSVGITPTQTMKFDVDVDWISGNALIGQNNYGLCPLQVESGTIRSCWWMNTSAASADTGVALDSGRRRFVVTTSNAAYVSASVDGGTPALSGGYSNRSGVNPSDLYLFAKHFGGTVGNAGDYSTAKLYGLKIYGANGALMRDYVPGIKDNVAGLYDRVNDKFVSSGSGTPLVAGPVVDRSKPDSFVEYVESDGSQWVDTGVDGRAGVKSEADIDWISGAPLGVIIQSEGHCLLLQALGGIGGQALYSGEVNTGIAVNSGRHLIVSEVPAGSKMTITVDGTTTAQSPNNVWASGNTGMTIWMFAAHGSSGAWGAGSSKFYGLKLWRTGSDGVCRIQRHFIPCVKGNRAGLYDAVSGVIFYSHSGTDLVASSTPRTLSVWRNEADDASLDNAANWCGGLPNGTDAVVCAPWLQTVSTANDLTYANLTVHNGAAIDLSGHTLTLRGLTGANSGSFVSGAAITLDLSGRTDLRTIAKSANPYVVTWESQPSATFTLDSESSRRFKIEPDATGVKIIYIAGGAMLIVY